VGLRPLACRDSGSNPAGGTDVLFLMGVVCYRVEASCVGLISCPEEAYRVCVCVCVRERGGEGEGGRDREAWLVRRPRPTRVCCAMGGGCILACKRMIIHQ